METGGPHLLHPSLQHESPRPGMDGQGYIGILANPAFHYLHEAA